MPPSFSGGFVCASADVIETASAQARTPERARFMKTSLSNRRIACGFNSCCRDHAARLMQRQGTRRIGCNAYFRKAECLLEHLSGGLTLRDGARLSLLRRRAGG